jgi:hypothetical protein
VITFPSPEFFCVLVLLLAAFTCVVVRMPNVTVITAKVIMFLLYFIFHLVLLKNTS